ncbi:hypothetical protein DR105_03490 [Mycoplasma hyorhinis]|uniref:P97 family adhesin n=2 Tax=Mesomycoplasma hyorhinis TaxID=2100 RepID=UPI00136D7C0F|nr:hypothetical protein [Mesomycoplasma hyorhinis]MXR07556.1 hypothetical protein [Mesomycoplasma hyorhinis]
MKKNKKKTLLLALFVSLGAISSFSLIVGLSSLAKYNAKNPIEEVQKQARRITGITFNPNKFTLLSNYEVIRDQLFDKKNGKYQLKNNVNLEKYLNFYQVQNQESVLIRSFPKEVELKFDQVQPLDDVQEFKIVFHFSQNIQNKTFNSEIKTINLAVKDNKNFLINSFVSEVVKSFAPGEKSDLHDNKPENIFDINGARLSSVENKKAPSLTLIEDFDLEIKKVKNSDDLKKLLNQYFNLDQVLQSLDKTIVDKTLKIHPFKLEFVKDTENQERYITQNPDQKGIYNIYLKISFSDELKNLLANDVDKNFSKILVLTLAKDTFATKSFFIDASKLFDFVSLSDVDYKINEKDKTKTISQYDILSFQNFLLSPESSKSNISDWMFKQRFYNPTSNTSFSEALGSKINNYLNSKLELKFANFFDKNYKNSFKFTLLNNIVAKQNAKGVYLDIPYTISLSSKFRNTQEVTTLYSQTYHLELRGFKDGYHLIDSYNKYIQDKNFKLTNSDVPILPNLDILSTLFSSINDLNNSNFVIEPSETNKINKEMTPLEEVSGEYIQQLINLNKTDKLIEFLKDRRYFNLSFSELDYFKSIESDYVLPSLDEVRKSNIEIDLSQNNLSNFNLIGSLSIFKNKAEVGTFFALLLKETPDTVKSYLEVIYDKFASFLKQKQANNSQDNFKINSFNLTNSAVDDQSYNSNLTVKAITKFDSSKNIPEYQSSIFYQYLTKIDQNFKNLTTKNLDNSYFPNISKSKFSISNNQVISNGITYRKNNAETKKVLVKNTSNSEEKIFAFKDNFMNSLEEFLLSFYFSAGLKNNYKGFESIAKGWTTKVNFEIVPNNETNFADANHINLAYWYNFYLPINDQDLGEAIFRTPKIAMSLKISNQSVFDFKEKARLDEIVTNLPTASLTTTLTKIYVKTVDNSSPFHFEREVEADKQYDDNDVKSKFADKDLDSTQTEQTFELLFGHPELVRLKAYLQNAKFIYKANSNHLSRFNPQTRIITFYAASDDNKIQSKPFSIVVTSIPKPQPQNTTNNSSPKSTQTSSSQPQNVKNNKEKS